MVTTMVAQEEEVCENKTDLPDEIVESNIDGDGKLFTLEILKIIKDSQQQHGLRHGDYQRYRCYCSRRIRRLRKVLKVTQGDKRHFKRKDVTETMVKDEKYLCIPLMMAERAWGYAMQLRQESNTEPRKKFHLVSRLRKAATYALQLQKLCENTRCDARTKLEAQAYVAWIHGSLHFELQLWKSAMENLKKAQMVYEKLSLALPEDDQLLYKQRVDEIAPSLRYCAYNIGDESAINDLLEMRSHGHGELLDTLDLLIVQTRERKAETLCEVEWRGRSVTARPERVRLFFISEQELDKSLVRAEDNASKIELIEKLLLDCKDAIAAVKDELKADQSAKTRSGPGVPLSSAQYLLSYLTYIRLTRTIQRNLLMIDAAKASLAEKTEAGSGEGKKTRPQDITRLYEIILQNCTELQQLPGFEDDPQYQQEVEAKTKAYKAFRCFYIAQSLVSLRRWHEAMALYQRSRQYAGEALASSNAIGGDLADDLQALLHDVGGQEFSAHAHSVLEGEAQDDEGSTVHIKPATRSKKPLYERLGEYREEPSLTSRNPNVYKLPPEMHPIPCKPLFFDLALYSAEFPSLDDKIEAGPGRRAPSAGLTGFVKGLWGWGGSGKK
ncbi:signal recognition particle subunit SRP68 [Schistocerca nitens]|uniref:signal recognition particle subunit SRP68 n=1 Tax=Schistocerca nitens TaxID=7011 RepID=UPI002118BB0D|nr:signal recognition particle subunit SRP68 [Schistocerca nitens]